MKMDFRLFSVLVVAVLTLSACSKQRTAASSFTQSKTECLGDVAPNRFLVKYFNGHTEMVEAESKDAFINGFLSDNLAEIEYAEHDFVVRAAPMNSPIAIPSSGFADNWGPRRVAADSLWQAGIRGEGVTVAVIDSGMDLTHVQLRDQVAVNAAEIEGNGIDDDRNGLVDDYRGYDFADRQPLKGDSQFHGTHVAGIISASHRDSSAEALGYTQGIAPAAKILPLLFLKGESGYISDGIAAIFYAAQRGARVINASWGGPDCSQSLKDAISQMHEKDVIFVSAAGNESSNIDRYASFPGSLNLPSQITVGSTDSQDLMSHFSNYGQLNVHLFAPGSEIVSTYPGDRLASLSGTSMAAPMVAGAVALLLSAEPSATTEQIREALYNSATRRSFYLNASKGRMDLTQALNHLRAAMARTN